METSNTYSSTEQTYIMRNWNITTHFGAVLPFSFCKTEKSPYLGSTFKILFASMLLMLTLLLPTKGIAQTYLLNSSLNGSTITTCGGDFYDSGGSSDKYDIYQDYTVTFCSDNGGELRMWFSEFKLKDWGDFLYIYDGASTASPQISGSPFNHDDSPGFVTSSGTCLTVKFYSNYKDVEEGWAASISCGVPEIPEICGNGIDDDADGLIDDVDPECYSYGTELIPSGSYIINMGVEPQTEENALLPYGLIWKLLDEYQVPVKWAINADKEKDGIDFTYNGTGYKGGPFIISAEHRTAAINQIISDWENVGVVGVTTTSDFYAPIERTLNYSMNWTLDEGNGQIAEGYLETAGIPETAYNWILPENLNCCNDVFVMPHADPEWESHNQLLYWNDSESNGGCRGAIWAGCKAVSELENISNPLNASERLNFLMQDPDSPIEYPAVWSGDHDSGTLPYSYKYENHPIMQFVGTMDGAQEGGAEQIYLPNVGWRLSTHIGVYDLDHPDLPGGDAAKLAFGYAFGDTDRGYVVYEGGHDVSGGNPENIAAQRAFLNFSFMAVANKAIKPIAVVPSSMKTGETYALSSTATGGSGNFQYQWTSSCGGTFTSPNSANTSFTAPIVTTATSCNIKLIVTDDCGTRVGFENIQIDVWPYEICDNGIDDDGDGLTDCEDDECSNSLSITADATNSEICPGEYTELSCSASGGSGSYSFYWDNGIGGGSGEDVSPAVTTTYTVIVTDEIGCTDIDEITITVKDVPAFNVSPSITNCAGSTFQIEASPADTYSYVWNQGLGAGASHTVQPDASISYAVTATGGNGCTSTNSVTVKLYPTPGLDAGDDIDYCEGDYANLLATASGVVAPYTFKWSHGLGTGASKTVNPASPTTYTVTVTSGNGCLAEDNITVSPKSCNEICNNGLDDDFDGFTDCDDADCAPTIDAGADDSICNGTSTMLEVTVVGGSGSVYYNWSNGHTGQNQWVSPTTTTTYSVTVSNSSGCSAVDEMEVVVNVCTEDCTNGLDDDGDGLIDCDDPDCVLNAAPHLADDTYNSCPGMMYSERVTYNDENLQNPVFSIISPPANGLATIDLTGKFTYTPFGFFCANETFIYQVCNTVSGCCSTATVSLVLGDDTAPTLSNVPADITIGCDDAVPSPPVVMGYDDCPGIYMDFEESSNVYSVGGCETYTITRTWSASDFCGNSASATQTITVVDQIAPELFQVYVLENGKRIVAGIAKRVTHDWKYVPFPISFNGTPMIFSTVVSNNEHSSVAPRHRQSYSQGFELRLSEEEANDGKHTFEDIAWIAIEPGANVGELPFEVGRWVNVDHQVSSQTFTTPFESTPSLFVSIQSSNDNEACNLRVPTVSNTGASLFIQEEGSADAEVEHGLEHINYFALKQNAFLKDRNGEFFGESGTLNLTNAWATIPIQRKYTKPVIIFGGVSNNYEAGVNVRVRNISENTFEASLQEWDYLDGSHGPESVPYMIVEGSIPGNFEFYCAGKSTDLVMGQNLFALDNCDAQRTFEYTESPAYLAGLNVTERVWRATDDCGNVSEVIRYDTCTMVAFRAKALLYGAMVNNGNSGEMRDDLRKKNLVPIKEPYSQLPGFPHVKENEQSYGNENFGVPKVTICHKPGTKAQHTLEVSEKALNAHLAHGDVLGACVEIANSQTVYTSIADGTWDDPNTWLDGIIPPSGNAYDVSIIINHQVALNGANLTLHNDAVLTIEHGTLSLSNGYLKINDAFVNLVNGTLDIQSSNLDFANNQAELIAHNSSFILGGNFISSSGEVWIENSFLTVGGDLNNKVDLTLVDMAIEVGGSFNNNNGGVVDASRSEIRVINSNFINGNNSTFQGDEISLWLENGEITNNGNWDATIDQLCVASFNPLNLLSIISFLPVSEDCAGMVDYFNTAATLLDSEEFGIEETEENTSEEDTAGPGTLNPSRLDEEGDNAIIDWLLVELRDQENETEILGYATVTMLKDGQLVNENGNDVIQFPSLSEGDYYVTVRHRNHLPLVTANPVFLSSEDIQELDFTNVDFEVMGGEYAGRIVNDVRYLWAGDFNEDGRVIYQGPYNDVFHLFSRVLGESNNADYLANFIITDYDLTDYNLDGNIIFQGPGNDRASLLYHSILAHAVNSDFLANYIVSGTLP